MARIFMSGFTEESLTKLNLREFFRNCRGIKHPLFSDYTPRAKEALLEGIGRTIDMKMEELPDYETLSVVKRRRPNLEIIKGGKK